MARLLVTGATGNVGAAVIACLSSRGIAAVAAVRRPDPSSEIEQVRFDFAAPETHAPALAGVDRLFLVRPPELSDVPRFMVPVIDEAKRQGVRQIVFLSLLGAEQLDFVPHRKIERHIEAQGIPYTFLRASFFMQNLSTSHAREIREAGVIDVPAGTGKTSFVDVRDLAEVAALALAEPGHQNRAYDLTGSEALDYHAVAGILSEELGRPIVYREPGLPGFVWRRVQAGTPLPFALVMGAIYTTARLGKAAKVTPDLEQLLGRPPGSLRAFVARERAAWATP